jgi:hypothetical protein
VAACLVHALADIAGGIPATSFTFGAGADASAMPRERRSLMNRLGHSLRMALAQPPALRIGPRDRHARARHRLDRRGVLAGQRSVPCGPFPVPEPERLVYVNETAPKWNLEMTGVNITTTRSGAATQKVFEAIALYDEARLQPRDRPGLRSHAGRGGDDGFLKVLGVQPVLGRMFNAGREIHRRDRW